jgi:hypothetical protein
VDSRLNDLEDHSQWGATHFANKKFANEQCSYSLLEPPSTL